MNKLNYLLCITFKLIIFSVDIGAMHMVGQMKVVSFLAFLRNHFLNLLRVNVQHLDIMGKFSGAYKNKCIVHINNFMLNVFSEYFQSTLQIFH